MVTAFYSAARIVVMVSGWLVALLLAFAADYMLTGTKWPILIALASWWTLTCIIYMRNEAYARSEIERSRANAGQTSWRQG